MELIVALHGRQELSASSQVVRETPLNPNSPTNNAKQKNVSGALGDDLLLLYRGSALSDATLNTEGKSFSAHRSILAARSPVFRAMFEKDETSEVQSGVVDIDDVDSETVDRMLVYLYGDSVGDLEWKEASTLYYAADKYEILPLREKCADFLKACLAADNACDLLVLADRHSDQELMTCVVDFILGHEEVLELIVALHGRQELSASSQVVRQTPLNPNSPTNTAKHKNVSGALGDDLLLLYRDSALSDATLNTEGKSFSAHRSILAARSPVFSAMFEKDEACDGRSGVVDIEDVDSETVDRMLVYLYGDSVGDLGWREASALYYAAVKYEILPLKENCSSQITGATLQLEFIVALHGRHELAASAQVVRETQLNPNSPTNTTKHKNVSGALGDDLLLLYRGSALSDAILNTEGKSFSVHRSILAARSPVFRAMFEKDETSEVQSGVVDIDDVDSETVDRMLDYLYGDSVGDLEWKEASGTVLRGGQV
ncbi:hypothetical protein JTE90_005766 [Oedothorax gibbosus]|uniref:BTB domain-containing protein n=1 Tax=Oedothorax gibbosus TaxID=931172 RepID=A0AAV6USC0_9ARAC|nr:hypothetical protein JTE90_005766 [Oedothorax gibbosus]